MSENPSSDRSWWQTLPGILTGVAAIVTAATGLIVAFNHAGSQPKADVTPSPPSSRAVPGGAPSASAVPGGAPSASKVESRSPDPAGGGGAQTITLPALNRVRLAGGDAVITILSAQIEPIDSERRSLKFVVRYMNTGRYSANFWSDSYRLIVEDVPRAPTNFLDEVVAGDSAKEGEVVFELPVSIKNVILQISARDDKSRIPLTLP